MSKEEAPIVLIVSGYKNAVGGSGDKEGRSRRWKRYDIANLPPRRREEY